MHKYQGRAKIAFLTSTDPTNKRSWSGTQYCMAKSLQKHCGDVHFLGPVKASIPFTLGRGISFLSRILFNKRYNYFHSYWLAKSYARSFAKKLQLEQYDVLFSVPSSSFTAFLETNIPIVHCSDATMKGMLDYYPVYSNLFSFSKKESLTVEQRALEKASIVLFPSEWATESAVNNFSCKPENTFVVPFGANLDVIPAEEQVYERTVSDACSLLFVGVEWERKGGDIAFETLLELEKLGIKTTLTVCGCIPPDHIRHKNLRIVSFLDKNDPVQSNQIVQLFSDSDFFLLPTRADFSPVVFCEASAFGLPSISTRTGGVSGAVKEGVNGFLLPQEARGYEYAIKIAEIFSNRDYYLSLRKSSRKFFDEKLNWDCWGQEVNRLINDKILNKK